MPDHYIRVDNKGYITKTFSTAFEKPLETDILIKKNTSRHYNLDLYDVTDKLKLKYIDKKIVEDTKKKVKNGK